MAENNAVQRTQSSSPGFWSGLGEGAGIVVGVTVTAAVIWGLYSLLRRP